MILILEYFRKGKFVEILENLVIGRFFEKGIKFV